MKPKEFWIQYNDEGDIISATPVSAYDEEVNPIIAEEVHAITYEAYQALEARLAESEKVIKFYKDNDTYVDGPCPTGLEGRSICIDRGNRAREYFAKK